MTSSDTLHRNDTELGLVRTIGRVAQVLLELRSEYERKPSEITLTQIHQRISELQELARQLQQAHEVPAS